MATRTLKGTRELMEDMVSISDFNRGKAARIFKSLEGSGRKIIVRNNRPNGVLLSVEAFNDVSEAAEDNALLAEAVQRLAKDSPAYSMQEVMDSLGISEKDIEEAQADELA